MIRGVPPSPRDSHSCTTVGDHLFVFGGTDGKNHLNDLHVLDTCKLFHLFLWFLVRSRNCSWYEVFGFESIVCVCVCVGVW